MVTFQMKLLVSSQLLLLVVSSCVFFLYALLNLNQILTTTSNYNNPTIYNPSQSPTESSSHSKLNKYVASVWTHNVMFYPHVDITSITIVLWAGRECIILVRIVGRFFRCMGWLIMGRGNWRVTKEGGWGRLMS